MKILLKKGTKRNTLLIDDGPLVEVLRGLGPTIFQGVEMSKVAIFVDWLERNVSQHVLNSDKMHLTFTLVQASSEIRNNFLLETSPLCNLDIDKLFKSLCIQRWGYYPIHGGYLEEFDLHDVRLKPAAVSRIK